MINSLPKSLIESAANIINGHPMIDVDGEQKHRHNSLGQPIHPTDDGIRNFHRWFGDSKTVDEHGRPKVFYHGTTHDFSKFDPKKSFTGIGVTFFSEQPSFAGSYDYLHGAGHVMPVYIKSKSTFDLDNPEHSSKLSKKMGSQTYYSTFSGKEVQMIQDFPKSKDYFHMEQPNVINSIKALRHDSFLVTERGVANLGVFNPKNVKSSVGNRGTFDSTTNLVESFMGEDQTDQHYNFVEWKKAAKDNGLRPYNAGQMAGTPDKVDIWYAGGDTGAGGRFFKGKNWNYGHLTYPKPPVVSESTLAAFRSIYTGIGESYCPDEDTIVESIDSKYDLYDVTEHALKDNPSIADTNKEYGIMDYKVEFTPETEQVFTTYHRDGAWEIHHQKGDMVGVNLNSANPPMGFSAHAINFIREKLNKNEKVRINGSKEMIGKFHKAASKFSDRLSAGVTQIEKGIDPYQTGLDVHEFYIYPNSLKECNLPMFFINPHDKIRFLVEHLGENIAPVKSYYESLRKQGHDV